MFVLQSSTKLNMQYLRKIAFVVASILLVVAAFAQPNTNVDLDKSKPKQYENRKLGSEKTGDKKFTLPRRITQNTYTHYNYYFNANNKLIEIVDRAKTSFKDDYTEILPFYNYTLDGTSQSKGDLDSVIYKCTAGILLHDLRNDWIDNLYMLLGKAYLYRKDFDSAAGCFQYINYTYAPKDEGYDIPLGSNASGTAGVFTISTKEKRNLWKQLTSKAPSRNESFVWQIRNYLEQDLLGEAAGLIGILRSDPFFPKRLKTDLHEMVAFWFYKQQNFDSAAWHLQKSLDNAEGRAEEARWEYLAGQMYQAAKKDSAAIKMYDRSIKHTIDPLMEVYARLNIVNLSSGKKKDALQENLNELIKLAKRDKYIDYRDIIYYAAAKLELQRNSLDAAQSDLLKSVKYSLDNPQQKSLSFVALGDINYTKKAYIQAYSFYDSVQLDAVKTLPKTDRDKIAIRKPSLKIIAANLTIINKEDSLQKVAAMPDAERTLYVKKQAKILRKAQGLKGGDEEGSYNTSVGTSDKNTSLFGDSKGEWYFLSTNLRSKGFTEFKSRWGKRNNVDNWRRQSAVNKISNTAKPGTIGAGTDVDDTGGKTVIPTDKKDEVAEEGEQDISFEGLMSKLPLTKERLTVSNNKIQVALFSNGETFQNKLEDYPPAIDAYHELLKRFSDFKAREDALFNLYYCYNKAGLMSQADSVKNILNTSFPDGELTKKLKEGNNPVDKQKNVAANKKYDEIYNLFLEGKFEEAKQQKLKADELYGKNFWTPNLLYIEAIYYVKQKEDATAINKLQSLISLFPSSPLAAKANTMIDVLSRRKEIEGYLGSLTIERNEEGVTKGVDLSDTKNENKTVDVKTNDVVKKSTEKTIDKKVELKVLPTEANKFTFTPSDLHYTMVVLDKVDKTFVNEAKGAFAQFNREKFYNQKIDIGIYALNETYNLLLIGPFENAGKAVDYFDKTKPQAANKIIPWIDANKYNFSIIGTTNLELLKTNKELANYLNFLKLSLPGKF